MFRVNISSIEFADEFVFDIIQFIISDAKGLILPSQFNEVFDNYDEVVNYFNNLGETILCSVHTENKTIYFVTAKQWSSHGETTVDIMVYKAKLE
jgi:hypothetical protein